MNLRLGAHKKMLGFFVIEVNGDWRWNPTATLEEQQHIVGILDNFVVLVKDLSSDIPAEIAARENEYEY